MLHAILGEFQVTPPTNFCTCSKLSAVHSRCKTEVKQLLLAFTVDRWASHTNIVLDFEQNFLEQQVPKSNFHSKLPRFTLLKPSHSNLAFMSLPPEFMHKRLANAKSLEYGLQIFIYRWYHMYLAPRSYSAPGNTRMLNKLTKVSCHIHATRITNFWLQNNIIS